MDWVAATFDAGAVDRLVDEVVAHLRRHESHEGSADLAADTVEEALRSLATGAATVWVRVEWDGSQPVLRGRASATIAPPAAAEVLEGGVWLPDHRAKELAEALPAERSIEVSLPVTRAPEAEVEIPAVDTPARRWPGVRGHGGRHPGRA